MYYWGGVKVTNIMLILAGLFLPLFPLSMVFNTVFSRIEKPYQRIVLLMLWPQIGLLLVHLSDVSIPSWVVTWGILTAFFYAFRLLTIRELGLWASFLATSAWALLWVTILHDGESPFYLYALGFSVPLSLLVFLNKELTDRFGAAYVGLYQGLAQTQPRISGILVMVLLAVIATPIFPSFFTMLHTIISATPGSFVTVVLACFVWLLWSWAACRVMAGLIVGPATAFDVPDLTIATTWKYSGVIVSLIILSLILIGGMP